MCNQIVISYWVHCVLRSINVLLLLLMLILLFTIILYRLLCFIFISLLLFCVLFCFDLYVGEAPSYRLLPFGETPCTFFIMARTKLEKNDFVRCCDEYSSILQPIVQLNHQIYWNPINQLQNLISVIRYIKRI